MSAAPSEWPMVELAKIAAAHPNAITDGPFGSNLKTEHYTQSGPRVIRLQNIGDGFFSDSDKVHIPEERFERLRKHEALPGDIVIAALGNLLPRACVVPRSLGPAIVKADCIRIRVDNGVDPRFVAWMLNAAQTRRAGTTLISGVGRPRLNLAKIKSLFLPLPPPQEQRRIVEVIEEQFSRLDAAEASLTRVERRANTLAEAAYRTVRSPRWPSARLSTFASTSSGGTPSRRKAENFDGTIPWVKSGELGDSHVRVTAERISDRGLASSSAKLLKRGTLMMAMYGATVGRLGILDMDLAATNQAVCAIEPHDAEFVPFLWFCLRSMRRDLIDSAKGGAQPNISQGMIRDLMIPMPPPDERTRLISGIARQVSACERVAAAAVTGRLQIQHVRRAILERAFSGRLVSRFHDEDSISSASVVLDADPATLVRTKRRGTGSLSPFEVRA